MRPNGSLARRPKRAGRLRCAPRIWLLIVPGHNAVTPIPANELYAFAFPEGDERRMRPRYQARFDDILAAVDRGPITQE